MSFEKVGSPEKILEVVESKNIFIVICKKCSNKVGKFLKEDDKETLLEGNPAGSPPSKITTWYCDNCKANCLVDIRNENEKSSETVN